MLARAQLEGRYDLNHAPIALSDTHVIYHEKPKQDATWEQYIMHISKMDAV
jgi:hypothetical protein